MIIKMLRRKTPSFKQLLHYIARQDGVGEEDRRFMAHNLPLTDDLNELAEAFLENAEYRSNKNRKNGVVLHHHILSFNPVDSEGLSPGILEDIATHYIEENFPHFLAFSAVHRDKDHTHIHFCISANERGKKKLLQLNNKQFAKLKRDMEKWQLEKYPQLSKSVIFHKDKAQEIEQKQEVEKDPLQSLNYAERQEAEIKTAKVRDKDFQMKQRTGKATHKDTLSEQVQRIYQESHNLEAFVVALEEAGLEVYSYRGVLKGVIYEGRKYRFSTLNVSLKRLFEIEKRTVEQAQKRERREGKEKSLAVPDIKRPMERQATKPSATETKEQGKSKQEIERERLLAKNKAIREKKAQSKTKTKEEREKEIQKAKFRKKDMNPDFDPTNLLVLPDFIVF